MTKHTLRLSVVLLATVACHGAQTNPSPESGARWLHDPSASFWSEHAPESYRARFETTKGTFTVEITRALGPIGADRFYNLIRAGYYDDTRFTRVVPNYIVQFGVARDSALNALWYRNRYRDDSVHTSNVRGTFAFAMTGPDTRTTQIYVNLVDNLKNDGQGFSPFGRVVEGMAVVDGLYSGYGENSGGGMRAGRQGPLVNGGNAFVDREYPKLDRLIRATIVDRH